MSKIQNLIAENPRLAKLLSKPDVLAKFNAIASNPQNPSIATQYASDPDVQEILQIIQGSGTSANATGHANTSSSSLVQHVSSEQHFESLLKQTDKLVVCDFYATWCE